MKKIFLLVLLALQLVVITGVWVNSHVHHLMGNQLTGDWPGQLLAWGRLAGLLAAFGTLFLLLLMSRVKWLEGVFGLDRLARTHHFAGFSLFLLLIAHPVLVTLGQSAQTGVGYWAQTLDFLKSWDDIPAAAAGLALMLAALVFSLLVVFRKIRYETWYFNHLLLYLALALAFGHQLALGSDLATSRGFKIYWCVLYAVVLAILVYGRLWTPLWFTFRHRFRVARVTAENDGVTSVIIGGRDLDRYPARAGQFLIVRFLAKGFWSEAHPFSVSNCPGGTHLRLTIRALGDFTRRIPLLPPGTPVLVDGPHGIFTAARARRKKVLLIAGGIGITPIRALAEAMAGAGFDIVLLYGNRTANAIVFRDELDGIAARSGGRMRLCHILSEDPSWPGERGRIDQACIERQAPDAREREIYLCGPPVMMKSVRAALASIGVPPRQVHDERFTL